MSTPACPDNRDDCAFQSEGDIITLMHSPIQRDSAGKPVGGGWNHRTKLLRCATCNRWWQSRQTELADAQGKPREWHLSEGPPR